MASWPGYEPNADPLHQWAARHARAYQYTSYCLWGLAILFSIGDFVTTAIGVTPFFGRPYESLSETVGVTAWVLETVGIWGVLGQKALILGLVWRISHIFPRPYPLGIALTAAGLNGLILSHNVAVLSSVGWSY